MTNSSDRMDFAHVLHRDLSNSSLAEENKLLEAVKAYIHLGAFIITGLFTYVIIMTVWENQELRQNLRYVLLCQHCFCVSGFNIFGFAVHGLRCLRWPICRLFCWILYDLQIVMVRGLMFTLALMSLGTCLSICMPLRYSSLVHRYRHWVMLGAWTIALFHPVAFTVLACVRYPWAYVIEQDVKCSSALENSASRICALVQLLVTVLIILTCYMAICLEGRRAGHFTSSNAKGRRTILIHILQICLHILPSVVLITRPQERFALTLALFVIFSFAQSLSPVVFGLRCRELYKEMPRFLPFLIGPHGTSGKMKRKETTSTVTKTSEENEASLDTSLATGLPTSIGSAAIAEQENEECDST